jgi:predicted nucleic acid-binding protein
LNSFVLDSSIALTWCFKDEETAETRRVLDLAIFSHIYVPAHWHFEMINILGLGLRRKRISEADLTVAIERMAGLGLTVENHVWPGDAKSILALMKLHNLTGYDAAYLELAIRKQLPLATLDKDLSRAARTEGLQLICQVS